jgi:hypothetical protein
MAEAKSTDQPDVGHSSLGNPASVDPTEASYIPTDASVAENARRPVAVHRKSDLNHDTPERPLPAMRFVDTMEVTGRTPDYRVIAVNGVGMESEPPPTAQAP